MDKDDIFHVVKAIVATQRDYGRRDDRRQARLKYLVQEWGIDKFRWVALGSAWLRGVPHACWAAGLRALPWRVDCRPLTHANVGGLAQ